HHAQESVVVEGARRAHLEWSVLQDVQARFRACLLVRPRLGVGHHAARERTLGLIRLQPVRARLPDRVARFAVGGSSIAPGSFRGGVVPELFGIQRETQVPPPAEDAHQPCLASSSLLAAFHAIQAERNANRSSSSFTSLDHRSNAKAGTSDSNVSWTGS